MTAPDPTLADVCALLISIRDRIGAEPSALLDRDAMAALLGIGTSTFDRLRAAGQIGPRPIHIGGSLRWRRDEVMSWIRVASSNGDLPDAIAWQAMHPAKEKK